MRPIGLSLIVTGLAFTLFAFNFETQVTTEAGLIGGSLVAGGTSYNVGLMQQQLMLLQSGLATFLAGIVFVAVSSLKAEPGSNSTRSIGTSQLPPSTSEPALEVQAIEESSPARVRARKSHRQRKKRARNR
jgi:hypothetical protein